MTGAVHRIELDAQTADALVICLVRGIGLDREYPEFDMYADLAEIRERVEAVTRDGAILEQLNWQTLRDPDDRAPLMASRKVLDGLVKRLADQAASLFRDAPEYHHEARRFELASRRLADLAAEHPGVSA